MINSLGPYEPQPRIPGSSVHGILQVGILEWVAMPFSRGSSQPRNRTHISCGSCSAGGVFTTEPLGKPWGSGEFHLFLCLAFKLQKVQTHSIWFPLGLNSKFLILQVIESGDLHGNITAWLNFLQIQPSFQFNFSYKRKSWRKFTLIVRQ